MSHRILVISDIHIGAIKDTSYVYNTLTDIFDKELKFNHCDAVIFTGDMFHRSLRSNEEYTSLAVNMMSYLIRLCKKTKTKIRCVYGTESHECGSYRLFNYHLSGSHVDMKVIETVTEEELFPNVKVLYIPEEYISSKEKHYKKFLYSDKSYNYIFGHGVIVEGMPMVKVVDVINGESRVPTFKSEELSSICKLCIFGHYHIYSKIVDNVYYLGSLFRQSFGEEEAKGYGIIDNGELTFVKNEDAYLYKTYTYEEDSDIYSSSENLVNEINKIKEMNQEIFNGDKVGKLRIVFKLPKDISPSFKESIRSMLFNDSKISPLIKESSEIISEVQDSLGEEYDFILDTTIGIVDKVHRYINKLYETDLSLAELQEYINNDFKI